MLNHVKQFLGPTLGKDEHFIISNETECPMTRKMQSSLIEEAKSVKESLDTDVAKIRTDFSDRVEAWCKQAGERGVSMDTTLFTDLMHKEIVSKETSDPKRSYELKQLHNAVLSSLTEENVVHPTLTSLNAVTGRVTVSNPPMQNIPASVRKSIRPQVKGNNLYYLDFRSMEPAVLAALSKDTALIEDIRSGDLYQLLAESSLGDKAVYPEDRNKVKTLFLATFMYGGNVTHHLSESKLGVNSQQWKTVLQKYHVAAAYRENIIQSKHAVSVIGHNIDFSRAKVPVFSRYLQSEAAIIFQLILLELAELEKKFIFKIILPVHDAVLIEARSDEEVKSIAKSMSDKFNEVVDFDIASVSIKKLEQETV